MAACLKRGPPTPILVTTSTPGQNCGDVFTAETAEGAEMKRVAQKGPPAPRQ